MTGARQAGSAASAVLLHPAAAVVQQRVRHASQVTEGGQPWAPWEGQPRGWRELSLSVKYKYSHRSLVKADRESSGTAASGATSCIPKPVSAVSCWSAAVKLPASRVSACTKYEACTVSVMHQIDTLGWSQLQCRLV